MQSELLPDPDAENAVCVRKAVVVKVLVFVRVSGGRVPRIGSAADDVKPPPYAASTAETVTVTTVVEVIVAVVVLGTQSVSNFSTLPPKWTGSSRDRAAPARARIEKNVVSLMAALVG